MVVLVVLLAITGTGAWIGREATIRFVVSRLEHDGEALIAALDTAGRALTKPLPPVYSQPLSGHYFVVSFDGGSPLRSRSLWDAEFDITGLAPGTTDSAFRDGPRGQRLVVWRAGYEKQGQVFTIAVAEDVAPLSMALRTFLWSGIALAVLTAGLLLWVQKRLLRRAFRRLDTVRADIRRLGRGETGQLSEDVPVEVRPLVREFNHLVTAWHGHLQRSRNAVGNLAHALKSPLQLLMQRGREKGDASVTEQASRMHQLVERELRRARLAGSATAAHLFTPERDIEDLVATLKALYRAKKLDIETEISTPASLPFDQEDMLELIGNLLDNAAKWTRRRILLSVTAADNRLRIGVEDDGPGAEPDVTAGLLARGTRLDEQVPGHGLGLAIANDIVRLYHGRIALGRSTALGGFSAMVDLPAASIEG